MYVGRGRTPADIFSGRFHHCFSSIAQVGLRQYRYTEFFLNKSRSRDEVFWRVGPLRVFAARGEMQSNAYMETQHERQQTPPNSGKITSTLQTQEDLLTADGGARGLALRCCRTGHPKVFRIKLIDKPPPCPHTTTFHSLNARKTIPTAFRTTRNHPDKLASTEKTPVAQSGKKHQVT